MKKFIAIAGNIGVGKSTLVEKLCVRLGWEPFFEGVVDNPYLADFYADMARWSFHSQIFFLGRRLRDLRRLMDDPRPVVQDRSVYEDAEIFARNLYCQGHISERDWQSYHDLYSALTELLPPPDLIVYLHASVPTLLQRIALRGRAYESRGSATSMILWRPASMAAVFSMGLPNRKAGRGARMWDGAKLGMVGEKKVHDIMTDDRVPRSLRHSIPLLTMPGHILWVTGSRRSELGRVTDTTTEVVVVSFELG